jgi:predicted acylesterase/phospholipase RssA
MTQARCLGLALEGGGDKGAWAVGVIKGLLNTLPASETQYDVISGISIGAINSFFLSLYPKGQERQAVANLEKFWVEMNPSDLYTNWDGGYYSALFKEKGFYNGTCFGPYVDAHLPPNPSVKRMLSVGAFDINSGSFKRFDETLPFTSIYQAVGSSGAIPFFFAPGAYFPNYTLVDGGTF